MASVVTSLRQRVDPAPVTAAVALGDLLCIVVFVTVGAKYGHGIDPVTNTARVGSTVATFSIGWVIASVAAGAYSQSATQSMTIGVRRTVLAWCAGAIVAQVLRGTAFFPGNASVSFFLVSVAVGLALLVPWRVATTTLAQ